MATKTTQGIRITVHSNYRESMSAPEKNHFMFSYKVIIFNETDYSVRLLRRHWHIFDSSGELKEVEGEGVIGEQPVISPKENYEYESACYLQTDFGKMYGSYLMERIRDKEKFMVQIPEFQLIAPFRLN